VSAASLLALIGAFDIVGTVGSGWLTDRFDARKLLLAYYGFRGLALLALPVAFDSRYAALLGFAVVYGLDWVATVPPTSALATATFPRQAGVVFAWIFSAHQFGAATAAWAAGLVRTSTGEYTIAFAAAGALALVAAVAVLLIRAAPRRSVEAPAVASSSARAPSRGSTPLRSPSLRPPPARGRRRRAASPRAAPGPSP
jgi:predicted MFS family arabinose efflux permease